ncbi:hypothetical protein U1Q18_042720, partial [Sarracenia purpurea var. burkii]
SSGVLRSEAQTVGGEETSDGRVVDRRGIRRRARNLPAISDEEEAAASGYFLWKLQTIFLEDLQRNPASARQSSGARQSSDVGKDSGAVFGARKKTRAWFTQSFFPQRFSHRFFRKFPVEEDKRSCDLVWRTVVHKGENLVQNWK